MFYVLYFMYIITSARSRWCPCWVENLRLLSNYQVKTYLYYPQDQGHLMAPRNQDLTHPSSSHNFREIRGSHHVFPKLTRSSPVPYEYDAGIAEYENVFRGFDEEIKRLNVTVGWKRHQYHHNHHVQRYHAMMAALDTSSNKDLVEMTVPWYGGWGPP